MKGKTANKAPAAANGTVPVGDEKHRSKVLKELVEPWAGKGERERVVSADPYFASVQYAKSFEEMGPWIHRCHQEGTKTVSNGTYEKEIFY